MHTLGLYTPGSSAGNLHARDLAPREPLRWSENTASEAGSQLALDPSMRMVRQPGLVWEEWHGGEAAGALSLGPGCSPARLNTEDSERTDEGGFPRRGLGLERWLLDRGGQKPPPSPRRGASSAGAGPAGEPGTLLPPCPLHPEPEAASQQLNPHRACGRRWGQGLRSLPGVSSRCPCL